MPRRQPVSRRTFNPILSPILPSGHAVRCDQLIRLNESPTDSAISPLRIGLACHVSLCTRRPGQVTTRWAREGQPAGARGGGPGRTYPGFRLRARWVPSVCFSVIVCDNSVNKRLSPKMGPCKIWVPIPKTFPPRFGPIPIRVPIHRNNVKDSRHPIKRLFTPEISHRHPYTSFRSISIPSQAIPPSLRNPLSGVCCQTHLWSQCQESNLPNLNILLPKYSYPLLLPSENNGGRRGALTRRGCKWLPHKLAPNSEVLAYILLVRHERTAYSP